MSNETFFSDDLVGPSFNFEIIVVQLGLTRDRVDLQRLRRDFLWSRCTDTTRLHKIEHSLVRIRMATVDVPPFGPLVERRPGRLQRLTKLLLAHWRMFLRQVQELHALVQFRHLIDREVHVLHRRPSFLLWLLPPFPLTLLILRDWG